MSRAPSPQGATPAAAAPARSPPPTPRAARSRSRPRRCSRCARRTIRRRRRRRNVPSAAAAARQDSGRSGVAFARAFGPCTAIIARSRRGTTATPTGFACSLIQARSLSAVPALTTSRNQRSSMKARDQVVDDAAVRAQHAAVERLAGRREAADVVGEQPQQQRADAGAAQVDRAHVRDVEHARVAAHGVVLLDLRAVADRHVPAAEIDHARAGRDMEVIERCSSSHPPSRCKSRP